MYQTDMYEGMLAETIAIQGYHGDGINAYFARPLGPGPFPGLVLAHHLPGWDEWYKETTCRFARGAVERQGTRSGGESAWRGGTWTEHRRG